MKGQRYRFYNNDLHFAGETSCELHISVETEDSGTKDDVLNVGSPVAVGYSFDAAIECQMSNFKENHNYCYKASDIEIGVPIEVELGKASADNQTTKEATIASGTFIPTSISFKADNKKTVTSTIKLEGTGELTV